MAETTHDKRSRIGRVDTPAGSRCPATRPSAYRAPRPRCRRRTLVAVHLLCEMVVQDGGGARVTVRS
jgi:hypothetical protein